MVCDNKMISCPLSACLSVLTQCLMHHFSAHMLDMVQEVASHGLGVVYDLSDSAQKEELVHLLVGTLMEGRRSAL